MCLLREGHQRYMSKGQNPLESYIGDKFFLALYSSQNLYGSNQRADTVITASYHDQIASLNPEHQQGIFSYYRMKGIDDDVDTNRDGKISLGGM